MEIPLKSYLTEILDRVRDRDSGAVADYIPELAAADPTPLAVALCTSAGRVYSAGDDEREFSIQSISKSFTYAIALQEVGVEKVLGTVGMEPSGEAFNELSLEGGTHRPVNPMINAGAIAVNQLINGEDSSVDARVTVLLDYFSRLAGRELHIDERITGSELATADRNLSLAHMLRSYGVIAGSAADAVTGYVRQCSVLVTVRDLAVMGATLALGGRQPVTGEQVLDPRVCRQVQAVMASAGMYDGAGRWMASVGIPAKSGVAGGLMGTLPGQLGLATFSPRLDSSGNSVRGAEIFRILSEDMGLHLMSALPSTGSAVRSIRTRGPVTVIRLQGGLGFTGAEDFLAAAAAHELTTVRVVVDMRRVSDIDAFGREMVLEGLRRIRTDGHRIAVIDPDHLLGDRRLGDGTTVEETDEVAVEVADEVK
ncbi:glutaminase [Corynebacterium terpenotabidum]|uniref:Glutaminase n=1 Tax=Corynebacterium terpenotabidum Y-11 TaxID=1200352 RepID=S4XDL2_9CORY|nr:glutaminase [Corynebacterium terpenotabidum]AGP30641.1 glutaminase [Corynebacterium terpenotabidum Y-11]